MVQKRLRRVAFGGWDVAEASLVPFVYEISKCCLGIFQFWIFVLPTSEKNKPGEANIGPRGAPHRFPKIGRKQTLHSGKGQAHGSKMGAQI